MLPARLQRPPSARVEVKCYDLESRHLAFITCCSYALFLQVQQALPEGCVNTTQVKDTAVVVFNKILGFVTKWENLPLVEVSQTPIIVNACFNSSRCTSYT